MEKVKEKFVFPEYLEPFRSLINNTGGNSIENLMNDTTTNNFNNSFRAAMIVAVDSQITLLKKLHNLGLLNSITI